MLPFFLGNSRRDGLGGLLRDDAPLLVNIHTHRVFVFCVSTTTFFFTDAAKKAAIFTTQANMEREKMSLSLVSSLKDCAKKKDLYQGSRIHADIRNGGLLEQNTLLGNTLVSMYARCGALVRAQHVFDELPVRDVVCWNSLIAGYAKQGHGQKALGCFQQMQSEGLSPTAITYACILKACGSTLDIVMGKRIHDEIASQGLLKTDVVLGNSLVDMYAKCGVLVEAQKVIDDLPIRNVVSWNALIVGFVQQGQGQEALGCFQRMQSEGISPDAITYACILKACVITKEADMGKKIHDDIVSQGLLKKDVVLGTALVDVYAQQGQGQEALSCFRQMQSEGISPNAFTYACVLNACGITQDAEMGKKIHDCIVSDVLLKKDDVLGNALINMYAKCGVFQKAQKVLHELPVRNLISWNTLIAEYAQQGHGQEALGCFQQMRTENVFPDEITYGCILKACGITQDVVMGRKIHDEIVSKGLLKKNVVLGNALVDMYAKCGALQKAQKVLDELPSTSVVSWNTLIAGYVQQGQGQEALGCFQQMQSEGISPDAITYACIMKAFGITQDVDMGKEIHVDIASQGLLVKDIVLGTALVNMYVQQGQGQEALGFFQRMRSGGIYPDTITYVCILKACGITQDVDMGKSIHDDIVRQGLLKKDGVLGNALVDMYAKCGVLQKAKEVLDEFSVRNVVCWSALIAGYVQLGKCQEALGCFQRMQSERIAPDAITYACILKACGKTQDADLGRKIHDEIVTQGLLKRNVTLGNALVDMYAKCGVLQKAQKVLDELPVRDVVSWNALIAGYAEQGQGQEALGCFQQMQGEGVSPNEITYVYILKAMLITS